jgi:predicted transcriptional regulator
VPLAVDEPRHVSDPGQPVLPASPLTHRKEPPLDARARQIKELLTAGLTQRAIARHIGVSAPRVSQIVGNDPELRRIRTATSMGERERLASYRSELSQVLREVRQIAVQIKRSIKALDEELESAGIDAILGLR